MKNIFISITFALVVSGCAFLKNRYAQAPEINLHNIYLQDVQAFSATMIIVLDVKNPNKMDLHVNEVSYEVQLNEQAFAKSKLDKETIIPAGETKSVEIPLPVNYLKAVQSMGQILSGKDVGYTVSGIAKVSGFSVPFNEKGKLNLKDLKAE